MYSVIDDIFDSQELDFEVELAFVIGKTGKKIKVFLLSIERTFQALLLPKTLNQGPNIPISTFLQDHLLLIYPIHTNTSMHILFAVLFTFPKVLIRRICLSINGFF